jgi:flagellar biosynthesis/type III secretory pathway chaperone
LNQKPRFAIITANFEQVSEDPLMANINLKDLGPLAFLAGVWEGIKGDDIVSQKLKALGQDSEKAGKQVSGASEGFKDLGKALGGLATAAAVGAFFKSAVQGAEEENQAMRRLKFAVEASGQSFQDSQKQINAWAQGIQAATRFTDGQAIETMAKFVRVTGDTTKAQKASQLAMSLSVATGKDLATTTETLTNLINKNERGVMMARKEFGAFIGGAENGQQVLDVLSAKFGDAALKEEGFSKETSSLSNNWNELKDTVGNAVIPALTVLVGWLNKGVDSIRAVGDALGTLAALIFTTFEGVGRAVVALVKRDFGSIENIAKETWGKIQSITIESGDMIRQEFEKTTAAHAVHSDTRVQQTAARSAQEIAEEKKLNDEKEAEAQRALAMAEALDIQLLSLNQDTLEQKKQLLDAETQAQRTKINKEISDARAKESLLAQLDKVHAARVSQLTKAESVMKRDAAFKVVEDTLETLSIINSMQSGHTKAQLARARVILALEKAIAIARLWAAEAGKGVVGIALASAGTAVLVAQYAQQSKALGEASKMSDGTQEFKTSTDLGNGQTFSNTETTGGPSSGSTTSGGISSLGSSGGKLACAGGVSRATN